MSWVLGFFGGILIVTGLEAKTDIAAEMRPWAVAIGFMLLLTGVVVYLVSDDDAN